MKLKIETTFSFAKLLSKSKGLIKDLQTSTINAEAKRMKHRVKTGTTITKSKMDALSEVAKKTRILRGHNPTAPPLNASGKLLQSIKPRKTGISAKQYGVHHNRGFTTQNNPVIPEGSKKPKGGLAKKQFKFRGKRIPQRQWFHTDETFKLDQKIYNGFFKKIRKALKK